MISFRHDESLEQSVMTCFARNCSETLLKRWSLRVISYPDLPRPRKREISLFSVKQCEIWERDYSEGGIESVRINGVSVSRIKWVDFRENVQSKGFLSPGTKWHHYDRNSPVRNQNEVYLCYPLYWLAMPAWNAATDCTLKKARGRTFL